jgi:hypothetical protein
MSGFKNIDVKRDRKEGILKCAVTENGILQCIVITCFDRAATMLVEPKTRVMIRYMAEHHNDVSWNDARKVG